MPAAVGAGSLPCSPPVDENRYSVVCAQGFLSSPYDVRLRTRTHIRPGVLSDRYGLQKFLVLWNSGTKFGWRAGLAA